MTERSIFLAALDRADPAERAAYLDDACAGDAELRGRVEGLLEAHDEPGDFLEPPVIGDATAQLGDDGPGDRPAPRSMIEVPGSRIGVYRLLQQLGEGGMGVVYMAEQEKPIRRKVALKVIKPGMDTGQVVARFEAERQALALMDHPNIARVLDAGTTESGRPYFVMDLVRGIPITQFCDESKLSPRERLDLFVPVCQAIQHAHQKGVIHRDVKPTNVMVTLHDGKPVPKIIDFGVAKATDQRLTERTLFTQYGAMIGTPEYMSPEQAELSGLDVDTRTDIFSLGVLLYHFLTGTTPLERAKLREASYAEILRRIKEEEAPKPSTRISHSGDRLASIAATRGTEPAQSDEAGAWRAGLDCDQGPGEESRTAAVSRRRTAWRGTLGATSTASQWRRARRRLRTSCRSLPPEAPCGDGDDGGVRDSACGGQCREHAYGDSRNAEAGAARRRRSEAGLWPRRERLSVSGMARLRQSGRRRAAAARATTEAAIARSVNDFLQRDLLGQADVDNQAGPGTSPIPTSRSVRSWTGGLRPLAASSLISRRWKSPSDGLSAIPMLHWSCIRRRLRIWSVRSRWRTASWEISTLTR